MIKQEATNTFQEGLNMDFNPLVQPPNTLTSCLNGTLITMNGNENVLQNDMGNVRVERAMLPSGYIPIGTTELGGIIYIASYNPFTNKSQIGSFPSPETNFTDNELFLNIAKQIAENYFIEAYNENYYVLKNRNKELELIDELYPGDKFLIYSPNISTNCNNLTAFKQDNSTDEKSMDAPVRNVKLKVAAIDSNNNKTYLEDLTWHDVSYDNGKKTGKYFILNASTDDIESVVDNYKNKIKQPYSILTTKNPAKISIEAEIEAIDQFTINSAPEKDDNEVYITFMNPKGFRKGDQVTIDKVCVRNNGKDAYIGIGSNKVSIGPDTDNTEHKIDIIPIQKFNDDTYVLIEDLALHYTIIPSSIQTGNKSVNKWKYFEQDDSTLDLLIDLRCFPEPGKSINSVKLNFYNLSDYADLSEGLLSKLTNKNLDNNFKDYSEDEFAEFNESHAAYAKSIDISNSSQQYFGEKKITIIYDDLIKRDKCYLVSIELDYDGTIQKVYKLLLTSNIFNDYYSSSTTDFCTLQPEIEINIDNNGVNIEDEKQEPTAYIPKYSKVSNIIEQQFTYNYETNLSGNIRINLSSNIFELNTGIIKDSEGDNIYPINTNTLKINKELKIIKSKSKELDYTNGTRDYIPLSHYEPFNILGMEVNPGSEKSAISPLYITGYTKEGDDKLYIRVKTLQQFYKPDQSSMTDDERDSQCLIEYQIPNKKEETYILSDIPFGEVFQDYYQYDVIPIIFGWYSCKNHADNYDFSTKISQNQNIQRVKGDDPASYFFAIKNRDGIFEGFHTTYNIWKTSDINNKALFQISGHSGSVFSMQNPIYGLLENKKAGFFLLYYKRVDSSILGEKPLIYTYDSSLLNLNDIYFNEDFNYSITFNPTLALNNIELNDNNLINNLQPIFKYGDNIVSTSGIVHEIISKHVELSLGECIKENPPIIVNKWNYGINNGDIVSGPYYEAFFQNLDNEIIKCVMESDGTYSFESVNQISSAPANEGYSRGSVSCDISCRGEGQVIIDHATPPIYGSNTTFRIHCNDETLQIVTY